MDSDTPVASYRRRASAYAVADELNAQIRYLDGTPVYVVRWM